MAMGWITQVWNNTDTEFVLKQNDPSWRPIQDVGRGANPFFGRRYQPDEPIVVGPQFRFVDLPWGLRYPIDPPQPRRMTFDYFIIPWAEAGRLLIEGPGGSAEIVIGPTGAGSDDFLKFLDPRTRVDLSPPAVVGPRGGGWRASVDYHLVFNEPAAKGAFFMAWAAHNVGSVVLESAKEALEKAGPVILTKLLGK
jgi:hypothetical protein